ncbi:D-alanine--D-alanine ligase family protein [Corynebacterium sp. S7]
MIRIAVVYGGRSTEHSISCISAGSIMAALDPDKYEIIPIGITREGTWTSGSLDPVGGEALPVVPEGREIALSVDPRRKGEIVDARSGETLAVVDVVFPVMHGAFGEDGTIQGLFEMSGVPYVGPGVLASACGMDKEYTKKLLVAESLPVTDEAVLRDDEILPEDQKARLGLPVFVKPAHGGSSIGVNKVTDWDDFPAAVALARETDTKVIVEAELVGDEVEVGVLEYPDGRIVASSPAKLIGTESTEEGFYGFDTKYLSDAVSAEIPGPYDEETTRQLKAMAIEAFKALNCSGLSRVDFFVTAEGPVINEINTLPGFTSISMYPQVFAADGISYAELLDTLVATALAKK